MNPAALAPEIDRLVWAVGNRVRDLHGSASMPAASELPPPVYGTLFNVLPFVDDLTESFVLRRYIYRPPEAMTQFFETLISGGYMTRSGDRLTPAAPLEPIRAELAAGIQDVAGSLWGEHTDAVQAASTAARTVLESSRVCDGLAQAAVAAPEPENAFQCLHQRLAATRLTRNEAHVEAWRGLGLAPGDVEVLTDAWAGTKLQAPLTVSERLQDLGYVRNGRVTTEGLAARQRIEDETNEGVAEAFASVDQEAFLSALVELPGQP